METPAELLAFHAAGGSDKHLRDVAAMLQISGDEIDRELTSDLAAEAGVETSWRRILEELEQAERDENHG